MPFLKRTRTHSQHTLNTPPCFSAPCTFHASLRAHLLRQDIDGCECHLLSLLLRERYFTAKVNIVIEPTLTHQHCLCAHSLLTAASGVHSVRWLQVVVVELNHYLPPPISYKAMCAGNDTSRSSRSFNAWGCSVQAAADTLRPHGYRLLQWDCEQRRLGPTSNPHAATAGHRAGRAES